MVGAIATVGTLIYLAFQIRQNSSLLSASVATANRETMLLLASDRDAVRVFWAGAEDRDSLGGVDLQQFDAIVGILFEVAEQDFIHDNQSGLAKIENTVDKWPGVRAFWKLYRDTYRGRPAYQDWVDRRVGAAAQQGTPPTRPEHGSLMP
jgi:hypothetical protein